MNKNKTILLGLLISILALSLIASTYAFVRLSISNQSNFRASLKAGTMSLVFSDGNPGFNTQISLGGSVEKIFTIENTGQGEAYATMSWRELQNTYTPGSLVYTLEESSDGGLTYTNRVSETPVPTSNAGLTIAENLTIPVGTTMYYKLTISYVFLEGVNQTQDLHAYLNTLFTLEEGSYIDKAVLRTKSTDDYWSSTDYNEKIKTVSFVQGINVPDDAVASWDMSTAGDGRIMAYLVNNENSTDDTPLYDLYMATNRMQIYANSNSSNLFFGLINLENIYNIEIINTFNVTDMSFMFGGCSSLTDLNLSGFTTPVLTTTYAMFYNCTNLQNLNISSIDTSNVTNMSNMFSVCTSVINLDLSSFNTSNVTNMSYMFLYCSSLTNMDLSNFDTSKVDNMCQMFCLCTKITSLNLNNFNTSNVIDMSQMFSACYRLIELNIGGFDTSNVTNMNYMFSDCYYLTNLDLSNFDTSNVLNMGGMFRGCSRLTNLDLSNFDTSNVTDMSWMFSNCSSLTNLDICSFNTNKVTDMSHMFDIQGNCKLTALDLSSFDTSNVADMSYMFYYCVSLEKIYVSNLWSMASITSSNHMFGACTSLVGASGTTFNSSYTDATYAHVDGGTSNPGYLTLKSV